MSHTAPGCCYITSNPPPPVLSTPWDGGHQRQAIPGGVVRRTIHQIWIGSPFPDHLCHLADTWRDHHPDWDYRLWDQGDIDGLDMPYWDLYHDAPNIVPQDAVNQFRSDLARWVILRDHGGLYADTDTWAQKPIDQLITHPVVVGWEIQDQWIGTSTIYADKGHETTQAVIQHIDTVTRLAQPGTRPNRLTGPQAVTPILRGRPCVRVLNEKTWYPVRWNEPMKADQHHPDAYVVHAWGHQREIRGLPAPGTTRTGVA